MKKIWVVQYNNGDADIYDTEQVAPAYPYVDAFEAEARIKELKKEIKKLKSIILSSCPKKTTIKNFLS